MAQNSIIMNIAAFTAKIAILAMTTSPLSIGLMCLDPCRIIKSLLLIFTTTYLNKAHQIVETLAKKNVMIAVQTRNAPTVYHPSIKVSIAKGISLPHILNNVFQNGTFILVTILP